MSGHTPGPWHATFYIYQDDPAAPTGRRAQIVSDSANVGGIMDGAYIAANGAGVCEVRRHNASAAADARLIAAAPEMLGALKRIADHEYRADRRHRGMVDVEEVETLRRIARAFLADKGL